MNLEFLNGTQQQKELYRLPLHNLLNLPFDKIPLSITVEFVDPSELIGHGHTDLAVTEFNYDSTTAHTKVRNDAPGFGGADRSLEALAAQMGLRYSTEKHFHETAAHETGHAFFAALFHSSRLQLVELFGGTTDDLEVIADESKPWQDRITEGIAETFKEAFLPRRYRVFPNRTNRRIPYHLFPEFRKHFRVAGGFTYVYGSEDYRDDLTLANCGFSQLAHRSDRDPEAFVYYEQIEGYEAGWGVDMSQFKESGTLPFSIEEEGIVTT